MKKILALGASVAMLLSTAAPVFAGNPPHHDPPTTSTNIIDFHGNDLNVYANTGKNLEVGAVGTGVIYGWTAGGQIKNTGSLTQYLSTGNATALGQQGVQVYAGDCKECQTTTNIVTFKHNDLNVGANTGKNAVLGGVVTGAYKSFTGGITNNGGASQTLGTGIAYADGSQFVVTGLTVTP